METKHTPGPWEVGHKHPERCIINTPYSILVAEPIYRGRPITQDETYANAKLIAAAPELLEFAIRWYESVTEGRTSDPILNMLPEGSFGWKAQQLIKKATE